MRGREEHLQQLAVADLRGVVGDLDGLGMAGRAAGDHVVVRRRGLPAGIAGYGILHAVDALEHALHAPEAATGQDSDRPRSLRSWLFKRRGGDRDPLLRGEGDEIRAAVAANMAPKRLDTALVKHVSVIGFLRNRISRR